MTTHADVIRRIRAKQAAGGRLTSIENQLLGFYSPPMVWVVGVGTACLVGVLALMLWTMFKAVAV